MSDSRTDAHLDALDRAFDARAWHGPNLMSAVRGMDENAARWRPAPDAHNAWEYVVHAAYWKYRVLRHVAADPPSSFGEQGSNFFERPAPERRLADDIDALRQWHGRLREAAAAFDPDRLDGVAYDGYAYAELIGGVAAHDVYHAGQIRLLRRLQGDV